MSGQGQLPFGVVYYFQGFVSPGYGVYVSVSFIYCYRTVRLYLEFYFLWQEGVSGGSCGFY